MLVDGDESCGEACLGLKSRGQGQQGQQARLKYRKTIILVSIETIQSKATKNLFSKTFHNTFWLNNKFIYIFYNLLYHYHLFLKLLCYSLYMIYNLNSFNFHIRLDIIHHYI